MDNNNFLKFGFALFFLTFSILINAEEKQKGFVIIDKQPWKTSWVQENEKNWQLISWFDQAKLITYFTGVWTKN